MTACVGGYIGNQGSTFLNAMKPSIKPYQSLRSKAAFTLVEVAVAAAIIGILAAIAIPAYVRSKDSAKIAALTNDMRIYAQNFDTFELEKKSFPLSQPNAGQIPAGIEDELPETWKLPSPIGGTYRWIYTTEIEPTDRVAYIEIVNTGANPILLSPNRLKDVDENLDDGDVSQGNFRQVGTNLRYYIRL